VWYVMCIMCEIGTGVVCHVSSGSTEASCYNFQTVILYSLTFYLVSEIRIKEISNPATKL